MKHLSGGSQEATLSPGKGAAAETAEERGRLPLGALQSCGGSREQGSGRGEDLVTDVLQVTVPLGLLLTLSTG